MPIPRAWFALELKNRYGPKVVQTQKKTFFSRIATESILRTPYILKPRYKLFHAKNMKYVALTAWKRREKNRRHKSSQRAKFTIMVLASDIFLVNGNKQIRNIQQ